MKRYNAIIIGFGKAGKTLAAEFASRGWSVAIIERSSKMYGGTCINIGCIPTKTLVHLSKVLEYRRPASFDQYAEEYKKAVKAKNDLTSFLRKVNYEKLNTKDNVIVYTGEASFRSPYEILVKSSKETIQIEGERIFINTGASTIIPNINGIKGNPYVYTSTSIMELNKLPKRLAIIGGGYVGLEFASMFTGFGSKVTVLEAGEHFIPREDRDIAAVVKEVLEKKGINIHLNAIVQTIEHDSKKASVIYRDAITGETTKVNADAILLATGRRPNTKSLDLEAAGIKTDSRGAIVVDKHLRTNVENIWAVGDVHGGLQFTYLSLDDYRIIKEELFGNGHRNLDDRQAIAYSVFIDPPLSRVGVSEEEALKMGKNIKVARMLSAANPRSRTLGQPEGLLKAVVDKDTGCILGCTLFCADSSEVINIVSLAMRTGEHYTFLRDNIFTHPSMSEALNDLFSMIN
ncbi:FAD-dependent oxidoreductase [Parabacteroides chinchillae]